MTNREQAIYNFLKKSRFLIAKDNTKQQHYSAKQINMFSTLNVTENELRSMEQKGYLTHIHFRSHGNCYYAI